MPLLVIIKHISQLFPQLWIILYSMLGGRMVDSLVENLFFCT